MDGPALYLTDSKGLIKSFDDPNAQYEPELNLINLKRLVERLNSVLADPEEHIELGEFVKETLKRRKNVVGEKQIDERGKYIIILKRDDGIENKLGYIHLEIGCPPFSEDYGLYENIVLQINQSLILKRDFNIPKFKIEFSGTHLGRGKLYTHRKDYVPGKHVKFLNKTIAVEWREANLSTVLPTEWLTDKPVENYKLN